MAPRVPSLATAGLFGSVLAVLAAMGQVEGPKGPEIGGEDPHSGGVEGRGSGTISGQELLRSAIRRLERRRSISAKIRHSIDLFEHKLVGSGNYWEERSHRGLLFRMELKIQLGDEPSSLLHVCDGRYLWMYRKLAGGESLSRIDVERVERALQESGDIQELAKVDRWPGLGGIPRLLRGLHRAYEFVSVEETYLEGREGPLPVLRLEGEWRRAKLAKLLPEQEKAINAGRTADLSKLPAHLPDHVILFLGKADAFPYRIEYRRRGPHEGEGEDVSRDRALVTMELSEVNLNATIHPTSFLYNPGDLECTDQTVPFLKKLGLVP
ncbi:MAG: hypothetical protein ABIP48_09250 [Planctomycetota bacterium]